MHLHQYLLHIDIPFSPSLEVEVEVEVEELSPVVDPETKKRLHVNFTSYNILHQIKSLWLLPIVAKCCKCRPFFTVSLLAIRQVPKHCTSIVQAESSPQNCWLRAFWRWMRPLFSTTFHRPNRHTNFQCFSAHSKRFHSIWDAHRRAPRDLAKGDTKPWVVQKKDWKGMVGQQVQAQHDPAKAQKWQNKKMGEILNNLKYSCPKGSRELDRKSNGTPIHFRKTCHRLLHVRAFAFPFPLRIFLSNTQILIWRWTHPKGLLSTREGQRSILEKRSYIHQTTLAAETLYLM